MSGSLLGRAERARQGQSEAGGRLPDLVIRFFFCFGCKWRSKSQQERARHVSVVVSGNQSDMNGGKDSLLNCERAWG